MSVDSSISTCPSDHELTLFHSAELVGHREEVIASHVGSCERCEQKLLCLEESEPLQLTQALRNSDPLDEVADAISLSALRRRAHSLFHTIVMDEGGQNSTFTQAASEELEATVTLAPNLTTDDLRLPKSVGKYLVIERIGKGSFGEIYKARDPDAQRTVAIKVPRTARTPSQVESFFKEARTIAAMEHPNVVPVYDWGRDEECGVYVVMQYVEGGSLYDQLQQRRFSFSEAAAMIADLADALHYAHLREIYHRDVKPQNILCPEDARGLLLSDFGLAIHEGERWRQDGVLAGTVPYMAPDQIQGDAVQLDGRADIWSLGVVFYEVLTRRRPFSGENRKQLTDEIFRKAPRPPHAIDDRIPPELSRICLRCLEKRVADRYDSAREVSLALRAWLAESEELEASDAVAGTALHSSLSASPVASPAAKSASRKSASRWFNRYTVTALLLLALVGAAGVAYRFNARDDWLASLFPVMRTGQPFYLLDQSPQRLPELPVPTSDEMARDPRTGDLTIDSSRTRMLQLADVGRDTYRLQVSLTPVGERTISGVYWGYHTETRYNGEPMTRADSVYLAYNRHRKVYTLNGYSLGFMRLYQDAPDMYSQNHWEYDIPPLDGRPVFLEIELRRGRIHSIQYGRIPIPREVWQSQVDDGAGSAVGGMGLFSLRGKTRYHAKYTHVIPLKSDDT